MALDVGHQMWVIASSEPPHTQPAAHPQCGEHALQAAVGATALRKAETGRPQPRVASHTHAQGMRQPAVAHHSQL